MRGGLFLAIGLIMTGTLWTESLITVNMKLLQAVTHDQSTDQWNYNGTGTADLVVKSTGNRNVKGELSLTYYPTDGLPTGSTALDLNKASIKVQFPSLRITMGKTRIGWGEGYVFNSGDVLFGSLSPTVDLTSDEVRSDTAWLTLVRYSLGKSYFEGIAMAPAYEYADESDLDSLYQPDIWSSSAGGRFVTEVLDTTVELGYLNKGQEKTTGDTTGHRPYISLHGYGSVDWYGSASLAVPFKDAQWEENIQETVNLSAGAFRQFTTGYDSSLSARLEVLILPWQEWDEVNGGLTEDSSYGIYLYPELIFAKGEGLSYPLMAIISPLEGAAQITTGFAWNVYQGFSFLGYAIVELGEESDNFTTGDASFMVGMDFKY